MMPNSRQPLFLARASYRKRRLRDGSRMLPVFGFGLLLLPMLWPQGGGYVVVHWFYVFVLWAGLIGLAAVLSRGLTEGDGVVNAAGDGGNITERTEQVSAPAAPPARAGGAPPSQGA